MIVPQTRVGPRIVISGVGKLKEGTPTLKYCEIIQCFYSWATVCCRKMKRGHWPTIDALESCKSELWGSGVFKSWGFRSLQVWTWAHQLERSGGDSTHGLGVLGLLCTVVLTQCQFAEMDSVQLCAIRAGEEPHRHTDLGNLQNSIPEGKDQHQAHQQVTCEEKELSFSNQYKNECSDCQQANLNLSVKGGGGIILYISLDFSVNHHC